MHRLGNFLVCLFLNLLMHLEGCVPALCGLGSPFGGLWPHWLFGSFAFYSACGLWAGPRTAATKKTRRRKIKTRTQTNGDYKGEVNYGTY